MFLLRETWRAFSSWNIRFEIRPFALLPTVYFCLNLTLMWDFSTLEIFFTVDFFILCTVVTTKICPIMFTSSFIFYRCIQNPVKHLIKTENFYYVQSYLKSYSTELALFTLFLRFDFFKKFCQFYSQFYTKNWCSLVSN